MVQRREGLWLRGRCLGVGEVLLGVWMLPEEYMSSLFLLYTFFLCALFSGVVVSEGLPLNIHRSLLPLAFFDDCDEFSPE